MRLNIYVYVDVCCDKYYFIVVNFLIMLNIVREFGYCM